MRSRIYKSSLETYTMAMKAFFKLHTKKSPRISSTQAPVDMSKVIFKEPDIESQIIIVIDHNI